MKHLFLLIIFISTASWSEHKIDYRISSLGNLVYQMDCMAQLGHFRCSQSDFTELWAQKSMFDKDDQMYLQQWKSLREQLNQTLELQSSEELKFVTSPNFPTNAENGINLLEKSRIMAFAAKTQDDYQNAMKNWLPDSYVEKEMSLINHFSPRFESWFANEKAGLKLFVKDAKELSERTNVNELLSKMRRFYRSELPESMTLPVYLVAHPKAQANSSGLVFDENSIIEVLKGEKAKYRLGVVLHEIAHFYHERASMDWHVQVMKHYTDQDSLTGKTAYYLFNEAMASAIGNGLFEKRLRDEESFKRYYEYPMSFYADEGIDRGAKSSLKLVSSYFQQNIAMDKRFLKELDKTWSEELSDIKDNLQQRLRHTGMVILDAALDTLINPLFGLLRPSSAQINTTNEESFAEDLAIHKYSKLDSIILAKDWDQIKNMDANGENIQIFEDKSFSIHKTDEGTLWVFLVNENPNQIIKDLENLLKTEP